MAHSSSPHPFRVDILNLRGNEFFNFIREQCSETVVEILQMQAINSVRSLLSVNGLFSFFELDSNDLIELKRKVGVTLNNGSFKVKPGISLQVNNLLRSLRNLLPPDYYSTSPDDLVISAALLDEYTFLRPLIEFLQKEHLNMVASTESSATVIPMVLAVLILSFLVITSTIATNYHPCQQFPFVFSKSFLRTLSSSF
jgi:hypothetical protein